VIPKEHKKVITVDRVRVIDGLRRCSASSARAHADRVSTKIAQTQTQVKGI
jgi:hypothetical protein